MQNDPKEFARAVRMHAAKTLMRTRDSHIGGGYSSADILAVLYTRILGLTPENLDDPNRNVFLLSKGHIAATFYTTLAYAGLIPMEDLESHVVDGTNYAGHTRRFVVPGVEMSAGSLGHGSGLGAGIAYAKKLQNLEGRVFVLMGDGECNEGSVWEAAMLAVRFSLNNLILIVDRNRLQSYGSDVQVMNMGDMAEKFRAFGCRTVEVDGHDYEALEQLFSQAGLDGDPRPTAVIAHTIKGKGVSFMENRLEWHFKSPNAEQLAQALEELEAMRNTFVQTMIRLAREDPKVMMIIGDTGFSVVEPFEEEFGPRFVNVGIAEQNFISFSAGLAAAGMRPFAYNVVSFMTLRGAEQILLDICYQENPVILVGVGGGFAYGPAGPTHHSLQDIAMMRAFPNMDVYCPADPAEMEAAMLTAYRRNRPAYIRIGRSVDAPIHADKVECPLGKAIPMSQGQDIAVLACGTMLREAVEVRRLLEAQRFSVSLYSVPCVQPLDEETVLACAANHRAVFTMEEHGISGGLGTAVAELLMEKGQYPAIFHRYGVPDSFAMVAGSREYQLRYFGLSPEQIADDIQKRWRAAQ